MNYQRDRDKPDSRSDSRLDRSNRDTRLEKFENINPNTNTNLNLNQNHYSNTNYNPSSSSIRFHQSLSPNKSALRSLLDEIKNESDSFQRSNNEGFKRTNRNNPNYYSSPPSYYPSSNSNLGELKYEFNDLNKRIFELERRLGKKVWLP